MKTEIRNQIQSYAYFFLHLDLNLSIEIESLLKPSTPSSPFEQQQTPNSSIAETNRNPYFINLSS